MVIKSAKAIGRQLIISLIVLLSALSVSALKSSYDKSMNCTALQMEVTMMLGMHVKAVDGKAFYAELRSEEVAKVILEKFYNNLDPYKVFLFKDEYEKETAAEEVAATQLLMYDDFVCKRFDEKFAALRQALKRHVQVMRKTFANEEQLFVEVKAMVEDDDKFKEMVNSTEGHPADEQALQQKAKVLLAISYARLKAAEYSDGEAYHTALRMISQLRNDYDFHDPSSAYVAVAKAITESVDNHTHYYVPREFDEFIEALSAGFAGIGIVLMEAEKGIRITEVIKGGAAEVQGILKKGDVIVGIDGDREIQLSGMDKVMPILKGHPDTVVHLDILRDGQLLPNLRIVRGIINTKTETVKSMIKEVDGKKLGYLSFESFYSPYKKQSGVAEDVKKELIHLQQAGVSGLVVDLRGNGGGSMEQVRKLVGYFIPYGPVVSVIGSDPREDMVDTENDFLFSEPMVVLIDVGSASASEIFAGALQDYNRALIVGAKRSFGKGSVQTVISLEGMYRPVKTFRGWTGRAPFILKGGVKVTRSFYYLPSGRSVQYAGVTSDVEFPLLEVGEYLESKLNPRMKPPEPTEGVFLRHVAKVGHSYGKWMSDDDMIQAISRLNIDPEILRQEELPADVLSLDVLYRWIDALKYSGLHLANR